MVKDKVGSKRRWSLPVTRSPWQPASNVPIRKVSQSDRHHSNRLGLICPFHSLDYDMETGRATNRGAGIIWWAKRYGTISLKS